MKEVGMQYITSWWFFGGGKQHTKRGEFRGRILMCTTCGDEGGKQGTL